jgi:hypothetical protein
VTRQVATTVRRFPFRAALQDGPATGGAGTTRLTLHRLRLGLLAAVAVTLVAAFATFEAAHLTIGGTKTNGVPAVLYTLNVRQAIVAANQDAAESFHPQSGVQLSGAGPDYQAQINLASQGLEQVAAVTDANTGGIQTIESVDGQLATYTQLIQQADADYARGQASIGAAEALHAAQLLPIWEENQVQRTGSAKQPAGPSGVLIDLRTFQSSEDLAVRNSGSSFWVDDWAVVLWITPAALLLTLLVLAQVYLARRFRRWNNVPLMAATVLLIALAASSAVLLRADSRFAAAQQELTQAVRYQVAEIQASYHEGQQDVLALLPAQCTGRVGCGPTVAAFRAHIGPRLKPAATHQAAIAAGAVNDDLAQASATDGLLYLIPAGAVAIGALILLGLQPRINEYRHQS